MKKEKTSLAVADGARARARARARAARGRRKRIAPLSITPDPLSIGILMETVMEEASCFEFDPTVPWGTLPYFIKHAIFWRAVVNARDELGWRTLHEQLFPIEYQKLSCWDCGHELILNPPYNAPSFFFSTNYEDVSCKYCTCSNCGLTARRMLYPVHKNHQRMYIANLSRYKIHVFGYLVYTRLTGFYFKRGVGPLFESRFLTGYHIIHEPYILCRHFDEDHPYTRRRHIFCPHYLQYERAVYI